MFDTPINRLLLGALILARLQESPNLDIRPGKLDLYHQPLTRFARGRAVYSASAIIKSGLASVNVEAITAVDVGSGTDALQQELHNGARA